MNMKMIASQGFKAVIGFSVTTAVSDLVQENLPETQSALKNVVYVIGAAAIAAVVASVVVDQVGDGFDSWIGLNSGSDVVTEL